MYGLPRGLRAMMCAGDVSDVDRGGLEGAQTGVREAWLIGQFRVFEAVSPSCSGLYRSQACAERAYAMRTTGWCKKMDLNLPFPTVGTHRGLPCRNSPIADVYVRMIVCATGVTRETAFPSVY